MIRLSTGLLLGVLLLLGCSTPPANSQGGKEPSAGVQKGDSAYAPTIEPDAARLAYQSPEAQSQLHQKPTAPQPSKTSLPFPPTAFFSTGKDVVVAAGVKEGHIEVVAQSGSAHLWSLALPDSIPGTIYAIAPSGDGGYWIGGTAQGGYLLGSINENGKLRWLHEPALNRQEEVIPSGIRALSATDNGDLLAIGFADPFLFGEYNALLLRIRASDGKTLKSFDFGRERLDDFGLAIAEPGNGGYTALVSEDRGIKQYFLNDKGRVLDTLLVIPGPFHAVEALVQPAKGQFLVTVQKEPGATWGFTEIPFDKKQPPKPGKKADVTDPRKRNPTVDSIPPPPVHALIVGHSPGDSKYSVKDADDFALLLQKKSEEGKADATVTLLTAERADKEAILSGLQKMQTDYKRGLISPDGLLVISLTLASHKDTSGQFVFCPSGWDPVRPLATGISMAEIEYYLSRIPNPKLLLLDASYSGHLQTQLSQTIAIASCGANEMNHESDTWENGAFMYALKEGVNGKGDQNKDGKLNTAELAAYILTRVPQLARLEGFEQRAGVIKQASPNLLLLL